MTTILRVFFVFALLSLSSAIAFAQDDEARSASGLPSMIGRRACTSSVAGADAIVSGTVTITGLDESNKQPVLSVSLLANGVPVSHERVKNRGSFSFSCIPRNAVTLIVELDGAEIGRYPLGTLSPPPLSNRQDVQLTWSQMGSASSAAKKSAGAMLNAYARSEENQKKFDRAVEALKEKKSDSALKQFKQITATDTADFVAWTELGSLYFTANKPTEAKDAYTHALTLKPDFAPALLNLGKLQISQKEPDAAVETLTKALAVAPESADVNQFLGEAYLQARKGSKAVTYLNKALELAPLEKAEIHLRLGALYNAAGAKPLAASQYKMFLEKVPTYPQKGELEKYITENDKKN
jgi:tetratricopeptide (TPR) repeat protein